MRKMRNLACATLFCLLAGLHPLVAAQNVDQVAIEVGEADLYPSVRVGASYFDNVYRSAATQTRATSLNVAPRFAYQAVKKGLNLAVGYVGDYSNFSESELSYNDHRLYGDLEAIITSRKRFSASAEFSLGHEPLGTGLTLNSAASGVEQIENSNFKSNLQYTYGAATARFNLSGGLAVSARVYRNRQDITSGLDHAALIPFGIVSYRLSADTRALLEVRLRSVSYDNSSLDRLETQLLSGLSFRGTAKSGGFVKVGLLSSDYADDGAIDDSVFTANIGLYFIPSSLSRIDVAYTRQFNDEEVAGVGSGIAQTVDDIASLSWQKRWSGFVSTTAGLKYNRRGRDCPSISTQNIESTAQISIQPRRWLVFGVGASNLIHTADACDGVNGADYEYQTMSIFVNLTS